MEVFPFVGPTAAERCYGLPVFITYCNDAVKNIETTRLTCKTFLKQFVSIIDSKFQLILKKNRRITWLDDANKTFDANFVLLCIVRDGIAVTQDARSSYPTNVQVIDQAVLFTMYGPTIGSMVTLVC